MILALDLPSARAALSFLDRVEMNTSPELCPIWVKVGLELFLAEGPSLLRALRGKNLKVFLDLKLHDIPNTVAAAVRAVLPLEPELLTVHAAGGPAMLEAAAEAAAGSPTRLLAVTVLTSMDAGQLRAIGVAGTPESQVERLASLAIHCGIDGLVCSSQEAAMLRARHAQVHLVTPGIRPAGAPQGDQQRIGTPAAALHAGANQLVIGRPITAAADPGAAYRAILAEIASALDA